VRLRRVRERRLCAARGRVHDPERGGGLIAAGHIAPRRRTPILVGMCRNIRPLFNFEPPATDEEVAAAALQYVRKISGTRKPSGKNVVSFEQAVAEVAAITRKLVDSLETHAPPKDRQVEAKKVLARAAQRYAPSGAAPRE
jgi:hypothetical protein